MFGGKICSMAHISPTFIASAPSALKIRTPSPTLARAKVVSAGTSPASGELGDACTLATSGEHLSLPKKLDSLRDIYKFESFFKLLNYGFRNSYNGDYGCYR